MISSPTSPATVVEVVMPQMGVSVAEGTVVEWRRRPGDPVTADEPIADVTTDKIDVEIPAPVAGVMGAILVEEGETVPVGTPLAEIEAEGDGADGAGADGELDRSGFVSPVVRRIAAEHGIDVGSVDGHGIGGRVRKADLLAFIDGATAERTERVPIAPNDVRSVGGSAGSAGSAAGGGGNGNGNAGVRFEWGW